MLLLLPIVLLLSILLLLSMLLNLPTILLLSPLTLLFELTLPSSIVLPTTLRRSIAASEIPKAPGPGVEVGVEVEEPKEEAAVVVVEDKHCLDDSRGDDAAGESVGMSIAGCKGTRKWPSDSISASEAYLMEAVKQERRWLALVSFLVFLFGFLRSPRSWCAANKLWVVLWLSL